MDNRETRRTALNLDILDVVEDFGANVAEEVGALREALQRGESSAGDALALVCRLCAGHATRHANNADDGAAWDLAWGAVRLARSAAATAERPISVTARLRLLAICAGCVEMAQSAESDPDDTDDMEIRGEAVADLADGEGLRSEDLRSVLAAYVDAGNPEDDDAEDDDAEDDDAEDDDAEDDDAEDDDAEDDDAEGSSGLVFPKEFEGNFTVIHSRSNGEIIPPIRSFTTKKLAEKYAMSLDNSRGEEALVLTLVSAFED